MNFGYQSLTIFLLAGVCLGAAMHFGFLAWRLRQSMDFIYAAGFLSGAASFMATVGYNHSQTVDQFRFWFQVHAVVSRPLFFAWAWYILTQSAYETPWPARIWLGAEAVKALLLLLFLPTPYFMHLDGLVQHPTVWNETMAHPLGRPSSLHFIQLLLPVMGLGFGFAGGLRNLARGHHLRGSMILLAVLATSGSVFADNLLNSMGLPELQLAELSVAFPLVLMAWEATDRLVTKTREQELMTQLLHAQKMRAVGELASGIAHDFNNLLASISLAAGALLEKAGLGGEDEEARVIQRATSQASELTRKLLAVGRRVPERPRPLSVHSVLEAARSVAAPSLGTGVRVVEHFAAKRDRVLGDAGALQGAFINLMLNARDAMNGQGRLEISTRLEDEHLMEIRFLDEGGGITPENLARIFDPYFTTKGEGKGTGLGLAMVQSAVRAHGGSVEAFSEKGLGALFVIRLPLENGGTAPVNGVHEAAVTRP